MFVPVQKLETQRYMARHPHFDFCVIVLFCFLPIISIIGFFSHLLVGSNYPNERIVASAWYRIFMTVGTELCTVCMYRFYLIIFVVYRVIFFQNPLAE